MKQLLTSALLASSVALASVSMVYAESQITQHAIDDDSARAEPAQTSAFQMLMSAATTVIAMSIESGLAELTEDADDQVADTNLSEHDPFEKYNRLMFQFNSSLDEKALRPLAEHYREYTPALVRKGFSNFFSNIGDVGVVTNSALQGKLEQAFWDTSRLTINTVAGLGGFIDVASMMNIEKNNEDFGQTFGVWGIPEGPYLVLPVFGPRTVRSAVGTAMDTYLQAEALGAFSEAAAGQDVVTELLALNLINQREKMLGKSDLIKQAAIDPYIFTREAYLAYRRCQVEDCDKIDYKSAAPEATDDLDLLDELDELDLLDEPTQPDELDLLDELN